MNAGIMYVFYSYVYTHMGERDRYSEREYNDIFWGSKYIQNNFKHF